MADSATRLCRVYETAYRSLLQRARPEQLERGVRGLLRKAQERVDAGESWPVALQAVYRRCRAQTIRRLCRLRAVSHDGISGQGASGGGGPVDPTACGIGRAGRAESGSGTPPLAGTRRAEQLRQLLETRLPEVPFGVQSGEPSPDFQCDAGLGGLARWLRAAGYDARFWPGIRDDDLLQRVLESDAILLTTDRPLTARAAVRWGVVPALLVPLGPGKREQLEHVMGRLQLPRQAARCMQCGGVLRPVDKRAARDEIPPRTYPWCDDYYRCQRCGKLFWRGTHWQRIDEFLERGSSRESSD